MNLALLRHDGVNRPFPAGTGAGEPPGDRGANQQQNGGDNCRESDCQPDRLVVAVVQFYLTGEDGAVIVRNIQRNATKKG